MKMSDNPTKYEVLIEQYLRSILDISAARKLMVVQAVAKSDFIMFQRNEMRDNES